MTSTPTKLSEFLANVDLLDFYDQFVAEDIDMATLPLLDKDDLKELGLSLGQRKKLLKGLETLKGTAQTPVRPSTDNPVQLRRLSVMFCDMVGSTQMGEQLNIDEMQNVLQHYYDTANTIAKRHNGRLVSSQGDGLVILFGYPRVLEGFAERCILAAQDLQKTLEDAPVNVDGHGPIQITTRIGIASGQAAVGLTNSFVPGDHMHLVGPVVNRAARLQTVAHPQAIAVDINTYELTQTSVLFGQVEYHTLKGLPGSVSVYHVNGLLQSDETSIVPVNLVGRETEASRLSEVWSHVQSGAAATVTISGDAGIGKTTLVRSFLATQTNADTRVIPLRCMAIAAQSPLRAVANALTTLTKSGDKQTSIASLLKAPTPEMAHLTEQFFGVSETSTHDPVISKGDREAFLDLLSEWIINNASDPTVLVLENAQWADGTTRELMARTVQRAQSGNAPLLMIVVTRDDRADIFADHTGHITLPLPALDMDQSDAMLGRILGGMPVPYSVRNNLLYHADGNPLMLETLGQAQAQQQLPEVAEAVVVPHTIYESVSMRLDNIRSGRHLIEALAVLGTPASQHLLAEVLGCKEHDLNSAVSALELTGLIVREIDTGRDEFSIRHKVYRDVIREQIAGQSRRELHLAAYQALSGLNDIQPEVLATHAQAAQDWENASMHALTAGEAFLKRSALIEAGHFLEMADAALRRLNASITVNQSRLRAITGLASVERSRFGIATDQSANLGQQAVELSRTIGDVKTELLGLNGLYSHSLVKADYPQAQTYAQTLLKSAEQVQNKTFVMIGTRAIGAVSLHQGDQSSAVHNLGLALDQYDRDVHLPLAHAHGYDHAEICGALLSMSHWIRGDLETSRHFSAFSIEHSRDIQHAHSLVQAISFRVMLGAMARHGTELTKIGEEGMEVAEQHGIGVMRAAAHLFPFATQLCLRADPPTSDEIADLIERLAEFRVVNPFNYGSLTASVLAEVHLRSGNIPAAETVLKEAAIVETKTGETWTSSELLRMKARAAAARGEHKAATQLRDVALAQAKKTQAATIALRITCDKAEAEASPTNTKAVQDALSQIISKDQGWDIQRAETLVQEGCDA